MKSSLVYIRKILLSLAILLVSVSLIHLRAQITTYTCKEVSARECGPNCLKCEECRGPGVNLGDIKTEWNCLEVGNPDGTSSTTSCSANTVGKQGSTGGCAEDAVCVGKGGMYYCEPLSENSDLYPCDATRVGKQGGAGGCPDNAMCVSRSGGEYVCEATTDSDGNGESTNPTGPNTANSANFEKWPWASGYKYRTKDSKDNEFKFKDKNLNGTGYKEKEVEMYATFPTSQETWINTKPLCRPYSDCPAKDDEGKCQDGTFTVNYTCVGDVNMEDTTDISVKKIVGGDTMYGSWGMLKAYLDPSFDDCTKNGSCFVGNATVIDTKAQYEKEVGVFQGFGVKILAEGPGDVYYFDQVRALTTAPLGETQYANPSNPLVVGEIVIGDIEIPESGDSCREDILAQASPGGLCNTSGTPFEAMQPVLEKAAAKYGISPAVLAAVLYNEGATSRSYWQWTPENVEKWSTEGDTDNCSDSATNAQGWYQFLAKWWAPVANSSGCSSPSRCNFIDASFAAAKSLSQTSGDTRTKIMRFYCGYTTLCDTPKAQAYADQGMQIYNLYKCN